MRRNRSMPRSHVIPVLVYPDVREAVDWLCDVFGLLVRWQAGNHRAPGSEVSDGLHGGILLLGSDVRPVVHRPGGLAQEPQRLCPAMAGLNSDEQRSIRS